MSQTSIPTRAEDHFKHAAKCKKSIEGCVVCQTGMAYLNELPPLTLSTTLENTSARAFKRSVAAVSVENLLARTTDNPSGPEQSPKGRAALDIKVAYSVLKGYKERGGRI